MPRAPGLASSVKTEGTGGWCCPNPCWGPQLEPPQLGVLTLLTTAAVKDSSLAPRGPSAGSSPSGTTPIQLSSAPSSGSSSPTLGTWQHQGPAPGAPGHPREGSGGVRAACSQSLLPPHPCLPPKTTPPAPPAPSHQQQPPSDRLLPRPSQQGPSQRVGAAGPRGLPGSVPGSVAGSRPRQLHLDAG